MLKIAKKKPTDTPQDQKDDATKPTPPAPKAPPTADAEPDPTDPNEPAENEGDASQAPPDPALMAAMMGGAQDPSMTPQDKLPPQLVLYMGPEDGPFMCGNCRYFEQGGSCSKVDGPVDPNGCCNLFNPQVPDEPGPDLGGTPDEALNGPAQQPPTV